MNWRGVIDEFRDYLPLDSHVRPVTLHEGGTPLIEAPRLAEALDTEARLFLKCEGMNPTGSFKDRGMAVAVSAARHAGATAVICASTGNTSASAAAYAARAGLRAIVVVPDGQIARGKLSQAIVHGATVIAIDGGFDDALCIVQALAADGGLALVNSVNPHRLHGQKTAAFEVCHDLGRVPDFHFIPVGNAGNITAYWMGYREFQQAQVIDTLPKMCGVQAAGAAPLVRGHPIDNPQTVASAIRIGRPASQAGALAARDESGGSIEAVTDDEILEAYRLIAMCEGIFAEPASAAGVAGLKKACSAMSVAPGSVVVCTLTGIGLKDPDTATAGHDIIRAPASVASVREAAGLS